MSKLAPEVVTKPPLETKLIDFDFAGDLDGPAVLTGTPVIVELVTTDLVLTNKTVSGTKAQVLCASGLDGNQYKLKATVTDDSTPTQTFIGVGRLTVEVEG